MKTLKEFELENQKYFLTTAMSQKNNKKILQLVNIKVEHSVFRNVEVIFWERVDPLLVLGLDATYDL